MVKRTLKLVWLFDLRLYENHKSNLALFMVLSGYIRYSNRYLERGLDLDSISAVLAGGAGFAGNTGTMEASIISILIITIFYNFLLVLNLEVQLLLV